MLPIFIFCCFLSLTVTANLKCHCDTNTTVGAYCEAKHDAKGELLVFDECKCKNGFENIQNKVEEQTVTVYCTNANTSSVRCFCDNKSALSVGNHCLANLNPSGIITYESGCKCSHPLATPSIIPEFFYSKIMVVHLTATVSGTTRNTTANATKASTVITTTPLWWAENDTTDENTFGVCNISKFSDSDHKTAEIILYIGSGWVVVWIFFTILYTMIAGVTGHHRFLDLFQELVLIIIFAFMGVFTMKPDWSTCTANKVVLQFCMMCILLLAMMQASFLSSLIKGRSSKNSRLPVMVNYIWPPFFAAVVAVVVYFAFKKYYDNNGVHCFCEIYEKLYWAYAFPAAILFFLSLMNNQMAVTACRMTRQNVDRVQLYWARRSCRGMPILITWFLFCFFCLLFAVDMQRVWLFGVYLGLCIIFGPMIFVLHTYCYEKSCRRLFETTGFTFYKPCPTKKGDPNHVEQVIEKVDLRKKNALTDPLPPKKKEEEPPPVPVEAAGVLIPPSELAPLPLGAPTVPQVPVSNVAGPSDLATNPTSSQEFYNWLTDKNNVPGQAENVLFKKNV
ncbi:unnamed protein product [Bursaphelenchus okinawaensis]|uniref:EGF-like domain-containing protein n=1 Tax=Bursaphelenchus okinawaensis TaxID=465554 RepID=A0A811LA09_9BILA|nr:unnamed protein product [Bursaphelenchus okinawaensis]CAG9120515.1 unnamed protein product [Bursaphelenchus okinawaensis]